MHKKRKKSATRNRTVITTNRKKLLEAFRTVIQQFATTHDTSQESLK